MKTLIAAVVLLSAVAAHAADLKVSITNIKNQKGLIRIAVFSDNGAFYKHTDQAAANLSLTPAQAASFTVPRLNPGKYAIAVIHDENENKKLDTNFLGMPKEGYCFSNSQSILPPPFEKASFDVAAPETKITLKMQYFLR